MGVHIGLHLFVDHVPLTYDMLASYEFVRVFGHVLSGGVFWVVIRPPNLTMPLGISLYIDAIVTKIWIRGKYRMFARGAGFVTEPEKAVKRPLVGHDIGCRSWTLEWRFEKIYAGLPEPERFASQIPSTANPRGYQ
jgi:hypothetical protein